MATHCPTYIHTPHGAPSGRKLWWGQEEGGLHLSGSLTQLCRRAAPHTGSPKLLCGLPLYWDLCQPTLFRPHPHPRNTHIQLVLIQGTRLAQPIQVWLDQKHPTSKKKKEKKKKKKRKEKLSFYHTSLGAYMTPSETRASSPSNVNIAPPQPTVKVIKHTSKAQTFTRS